MRAALDISLELCVHDAQCVINVLTDETKAFGEELKDVGHAGDHRCPDLIGTRTSTPKTLTNILRVSGQIDQRENAAYWLAPQSKPSSSFFRKFFKLFEFFEGLGHLLSVQLHWPITLSV